MEGQLFRAVCLTLLMGTVLSCVASETSQQKFEANFTTTIPKEGLERDVEQVFYLGPSSTLQVIDETGKAKYLPEPSQSDDEASSGPYTAAYLFENGACDFTQTVEFKDAFQGYTKPLWVLEESDSVETEGASMGGPLRYTFTNPSAEYLGGGSSFCVRFKTVLATGSDSHTKTSTPATSSQGDSQGSSKPENGEALEQNQNGGGPSPPSAGNPGPSEQDSDRPEEEGVGGLSEEAKAESPVLPPHSSSIVDSGLSSHESPPTTDAHQANQKTEQGLSPAPEDAGASVPGKDGDGLSSSSIEEHIGSRLRRLSEDPPVKDAFLTIVVHSGALSIAGGMSALSVFLLALAASLPAAS
uniref:Toxoplasma gondii family A protein n=1 Tax=Neospora caninum (strain Liverpool) TaxID=572307 RepID=F0JAX8_NEOCL|nr:hypothetical protein NCLIV_069050 [Neospora caninum Liverpool]CEL71244.1 TPA: hypothetical protein BN1204_069050 [Neospora caninum Liverpool]